MTPDERTRLIVNALREVESRKFGNPHSNWTDYANVAHALESGDLVVTEATRLAAADGHQEIVHQLRSDTERLEALVQQLVDAVAHYGDWSPGSKHMCDEPWDCTHPISEDALAAAATAGFKPTEAD